jgi:hypothetical protein
VLWGDDGQPAQDQAETRDNASVSQAVEQPAHGWGGTCQGSAETARHGKPAHMWADQRTAEMLISRREQPAHVWGGQSRAGSNRHRAGTTRPRLGRTSRQPHFREARRDNPPTNGADSLPTVFCVRTIEQPNHEWGRYVYLLSKTAEMRKTRLRETDKDAPAGPGTRIGKPAHYGADPIHAAMSRTKRGQPAHVQGGPEGTSEAADRRRLTRPRMGRT